ncbi:hypothetical protein HS088_TW10G00062 [Tripterygium wilfordii]|uniref:Defensin-like protein n=1 Tax=Tripterygium wilfordii TaxID=458696 RepID=A0A7J7D3Z3_TRIWF|nr:hypothetical protein HS088_TW10G00062 [Tripterygium wilfordii]
MFLIRINPTITPFHSINAASIHQTTKHIYTNYKTKFSLEMESIPLHALFVVLLVFSVMEPETDAQIRKEVCQQNIAVGTNCDVVECSKDCAQKVNPNATGDCIRPDDKYCKCSWPCPCPCPYLSPSTYI